MKYEIINLEDIPEDLPAGMYNTKVLEAKVVDKEFVITLKYIGTEYDPMNPQCLLPLIKNENGSLE